MKFIGITIRLVLLLLSTLTTHAAGDPKTGEDKSHACSACHGAEGVSVNPEWPHLAGQHAAYLIKELHDFKHGHARHNPMMSPLVAYLTDNDMENIAAYYAQKPPAHGKTPKAYFNRGDVLYHRGDLNKHITACIACHGPDGQGNAEAGFPRLSGQQSIYTIQQLQAFQSGNRSNDLRSIMHDISRHMSHEDMEAIAYYLAGMPH